MLATAGRCVSKSKTAPTKIRSTRGKPRCGRATPIYATLFHAGGRPIHDVCVFRSGQNDRPLAAESDADGGGFGSGLQTRAGLRCGERLHLAILPEAVCRTAPW